MNSRGFTLIELILYIGLAGIFISAAIMFSIEVIKGREKSIIQTAVEQNDRIALNRIVYEIKDALSINSVSANQISLATKTAGTNPTIISLASNKVMIQQGASAAVALTSNQIKVSSLTFTNLSPSINDSKNISVSLTTQQTSSAVSASYTGTTTMQSSAELKTNFNDERKLLVDMSATSLQNGNKNIQGTTLQNSHSSGSITIDKMKVSWSGGTGGNTLQDIIINGVTVWSGTGNSGDLLDITNTSLTAGAAPIPLDRLRFNNAIDNSSITINFIMLDGSTVIMELLFGTVATTPTPTPPAPTSTPSPTPTPTNTPTPIIVNCTTYCLQTYTVPGLCLKSNQCVGVYAGTGTFGCISPNGCCCQ